MPDTTDASADAVDDAPATALTEEHHDWVSEFTGIDTRSGAGADACATTAASSAGATASASSGDVSTGDSSSGGGFFSGITNAVSGAASAVTSAVSEAASSVTSTIGEVASTATEMAAPPQTPASTDDQGQNAGSGSDIFDSIGSAAASVGNAVVSAGSAVVDGAKSTYNAVTDAYDAVAPNFTEANKGVGALVDMGEGAVKKANDQAIAQTADVPVLGSLVKASSWLSEKTTEAVGGVVKGVGDIASAAGNAMFHPIDAAESMAKGALGIAEHVPIIPGLNTTVKGIHGLVDLAEGKKDGEYGSNLSELGENLLLDTKQDPNDPTNHTNADVDFFAGLGGGTQAWIDKPVRGSHPHYNQPPSGR